MFSNCFPAVTAQVPSRQLHWEFRCACLHECSMGICDLSPLLEALALKINMSFPFQSPASPIVISPSSSPMQPSRVFCSIYPCSTLSFAHSQWGLSLLSPSHSSPYSASLAICPSITTPLPLLCLLPPASLLLLLVPSFMPFL